MVMDGRQFDALMRTLVGNSPRRHVLKGLVGGLASGLLSLWAVRPALATPTHTKTLERLNEKCVKEFGFPDFVSVDPAIDLFGDSCQSEDGGCACEVLYTCQYDPDPTVPGGGPYGEGQILFWQTTKRVVVPSAHCV
jgi:hypothetical protein